MSAPAFKFIKNLVLVWFLLFGSTYILVQAQNIETKKGKPHREYSVIVTENGYYPEKMIAFAGETVRFFVTSTLKAPSCFILSEKKLFLSAHMGRVTEGIGVFEHPGEYEFHCPGQNIKGKVVVLKKSTKEDKEAERRVASEKAPEKWVPKGE